MDARVFSWDWKAQPDMAAIAATVSKLSAKGQVFMRPIDAGGDYAWVVSGAELTDEQAWRLYLGEDEEPTPVQPADELRAAAKLMRERAEAATEGPWQADHKDAEYVASMHPGVALAVADWLDQEAVNAEAFTGHGNWLAAPSPHAITVARAYLGGQIEALAEVAGTFTEGES